MRLLVIVIVSLVFVVVEAGRFSYDHTPYPRVPNGKDKRSSQPSHELSELTERRTPITFSLQKFGNALKPFQGYFSAGIVLMALLKLARERGLFANFVMPSFWRESPSKIDDLPIKELKSEQEEMWNHILKLSNIQKDNTASIESNTASLLELQSQQSQFVEQQQQINTITTRLDEIDQSLLELSTSVSTLTQSANEVSEVREGLNAVEDRVERESRATSASVKQIREELPVMMQRHDSMVTEKLGRFKEELKRILTTTKVTSGTSAGTSGSSSGASGSSGASASGTRGGGSSTGGSSAGGAKNKTSKSKKK